MTYLKKYMSMTLYVCVYVASFLTKKRWLTQMNMKYYEDDENGVLTDRSSVYIYIHYCSPTHSLS
jgi:hypothetical protein